VGLHFRLFVFSELCEESTSVFTVSFCFEVIRVHVGTELYLLGLPVYV
jgi:hypothetical protein